MSSSSTQLLDSDLVNEWSELLHHEQDLVSSFQHHHGQILENGCYLPGSLMRSNKKSSSPSVVASGGGSPLPSSNTTTTSWIELKSSTKCKAPPIPEPKETPMHKSIRPAPAIPPNVRRKIEEEPITKQPPPRSGSVSRGLQVEEEDLIQFSEPDGHNRGLHPTSEDSSRSAASSGRRRNPGRESSSSHSNGTLPDKKILTNGETKLPPEDEEGTEDLDDEDAVSNRTADEQMDYLESLEPCPCYAKCCLDSIITLFCVTLLG